MDAATFDAITNTGRAVAELAAATGLAGAVFKYFQTKAVDFQALANNKIVGAASRAATGLITDVIVQGKSITDPSVINDVISSLRDSLTATHADSINVAGASSADVTRIASNAVKAAVQTAIPATAPPAAASPTDSLMAAVATVSAAKTALDTVTVKPVAPPPPAV